MSYLSLSGGKCTLIRLRKESVFSSLQIFFCSFLPAYLINLTVQSPQCKNTESHRIVFLMIWTPKSHGQIYFVFVRFFLLTCNIQEYIFVIPFIWYVIEILQLCFDFFFGVIYCFLSLLLILEHQPLKLSGVYFRCRLIIVQPKAIFVYVLNVCIFLQ